MEVDEAMVDKMAQLIQQSSTYDDIQVVERFQISQQQYKYKNYDTLKQALQQFIQVKPSDEQLLENADYLVDRKILIQKNLQLEIKKIDNLTPSGLVPIDYYSYKQKQGKKLIQHFKKIFVGNRQIDDHPEQFLAPFLIHYKQQLEKTNSLLINDPQVKKKLLVSQNTQTQDRLGQSLRRSTRATYCATDEKMILDEKRKALYNLELLVLKAVIAVERINFYTMGVIMPRDQNMALIPFFEAQKDPIYDYQSCLKICSLIKNQIERLEQIERQLAQPNYSAVPVRGTISKPEKSFYFNKLLQTDTKDKFEFREKFASEESRKRCLDIWHEFSQDQTFSKSPENLRVNLHIKIVSLAETFQSLGYKVSIQLFERVATPHSSATYILDNRNSWLFTEIKFAETILKDDLVLIIKLYSQYEIQSKDVKSKQKINAKSTDPMKLSFLKAFSIANLSDAFFDNKMKEGKPLDPMEIKFYQHDPKYCYELDYDTILNEMKYDQFKGTYDEALTKALNLKLQITLVSSIMRNQLSLRLDQCLVIRQSNYWDRMVRDKNHSLHQTDPMYIFEKEMQDLNLAELQKPETTNELRVNLNSLVLKDKSMTSHLTFRVQVFVVEKSNQSSNLKYLETIYQTGLSGVKLSESYQTEISSLNKKGIVNFRNEFNLRVPITLKTKDLGNYKLVFFIYVPHDNNKVHIKITEMMAEQEPQRYLFYPVYFAKLSLLDSSKACIVGSDKKEMQLPLMKFTPSKYLQEQIDLDNEPLPGAVLIINLNLNSQQYSTNNYVNQIVENSNVSIINELTQIIESYGLSNNDLLIYHTRIIYQLLHLYNNTQDDQCDAVLKAIVLIFKRFSSNELKPYKSLMQDFSERWRGDRESDKKLLFKLTKMLEKIPESIIDQLEKPLDMSDCNAVSHICQQLNNMPAVLGLICKLFSREFQTQYASIREKINTFFRKWMDRDLCIYRPDLVESYSNLLHFICSKPKTVVEQLEIFIQDLQRNYKVNQQIKEQIDEDVENENPFGGNSDDDFEFIEAPRLSQVARTTFHNQTNNYNDIDMQMANLVKMVQEIKVFQTDFCQSIQNVILSTSRYLHSEIELVKDDAKFCQQIEQIISLQSKTTKLTPLQQIDLDKAIQSVFGQYSTCILNFPAKTQSRLLSYYNRRKELRKTYWTILIKSIKVVLNFIDRKFVLTLFDENLLLKRIDPVLDRIVETIIPKFDLCTKYYGQFYKSQQEYISQTSKNEVERQDKRDQFESIIKSATNKYKQLREEEQREIEKQVKAKVLMLSEFLASDVFTMLSSEQGPVSPHIHITQEAEEPLLEVLATKISLSVYYHLKQYKNQFKEVGDSRSSLSEKTKDCTQSELQYLFLYKMSVFEKNYFACQHEQAQQDYSQPAYSFHTKGALLSARSSYRQMHDFDDLDNDLLGGLSSNSKMPKSSMQFNQIEEESKVFRNTQPSIGTTGNQQKGQAQTVLSGSKRSSNPLEQSIKSKHTEDKGKKDKLEFLYLQFDQGTSERRLCYFLNEMEDALCKYQELKDHAQSLSVDELAKMKAQYISLFSVLTLQHLQSLTPYAFKILYTKRPGSLDRLVKQLKVTTRGLEFGDEEFFFNIKKLQVVQQFCSNVIEVLCDSSNKQYIASLSDKYTYKSIVSSVWVLQLTLLAEQAQVLYELVAMGSVLKGPDYQHKKNIEDFTQRLQQHFKLQQVLWNNYKDIGDIILPDESQDLYSGIQGRLMKILQVDLDDQYLEKIDQKKLQQVLRPLATMFIQIDELTFKTQGELNYRCFVLIERFFKEFVDYSGLGQSGNKQAQSVQKAKKKQICDKFCDEYAEATSLLNSKDPKFSLQIKERVTQITQLKTLYLNIITYEKTALESGNLLLQLISYFKLMQLLQERMLCISFQNNLKVKYKNMIQNINDALYNSYLQEVAKADNDPDYICQKQVSQYKEQMKEVKAFMHVEDYYTYRSALDKGLLDQIGNTRNVRTLEVIIDEAVSLLVPPKDAKSKLDYPPNQFFDKALELLSHKRALQETNYDFGNVISTLDNQKEHYRMYENFEVKQIYCNYYRIKIESFLPVEMQVQDRHFVYRTPSGYNQEFIKHDLAVLLNNPSVATSSLCDVKPIQPLTSEVRKKYNILPNTVNLEETPDEVNCPPRFRTYFKQNFKKQFYVENCPSNDPASFDEEYSITIYEVKKAFPTMTMIQEVNRRFEKRIPRVKVELFTVTVILNEIQNVLMNQRQKGQNDAFTYEDSLQDRSKNEASSLDDLLQKYVTNDDVGGGLPKMLDLFFNESMAQSFIQLDNIDIKRAYLNLFKGIEKWLNELIKVVEVFSIVGRNSELTKLAEERLEDRQKLVSERKKLYKMTLLQDNF